MRRVAILAIAAALVACSREVIIEESDAGAGGTATSTSSSSSSSSSEASSSTGLYCIASLKACFDADETPCATTWQGPIDGSCVGGSCCRGGP